MASSTFHSCIPNERRPNLSRESAIAGRELGEDAEDDAVGRETLAAVPEALVEADRVHRHTVEVVRRQARRDVLPG